ncbi:MAG: amino acid adenylation domain-containing protein [Oscillospiraceae bacterium]|nr:amino acid adenylation domain-containing protein [Oscillospiraceae bacterium]
MWLVQSYLKRAVARYPNHPAVVDPEQSFSYSQLADKLNHLTSALLAGGVSHRQPVPVLLPKSCLSVAVLLSVAQAGAFYVPLNPDQPPARLGHLLQRLNAALVISDAQGQQILSTAGFAGQVWVAEDLLQQPLQPELMARRQHLLLDTDPLYCNFTSGSTGEPKGVLISQRSVVDFIEAFVPLAGLSHTSVIGNQAPYDFDVFVKDLYGSLCCGATLVLIPTPYFTQPARLLDYICDQQVDTLIWAVSALCLISMLKGFSYRVPRQLRQVLFSGEPMPLKQLKIWMDHLPQTRFINLYGPTEITCNCTYFEVPGPQALSAPLPIGRPFANEAVFLLDDRDQQITAPEQEGQLCVAGTCLALGYYMDPVRTAEHFTLNPLNPAFPERIYRTGDMAYYRPDGNLMFTGRRDGQIKLMGHRIELGEIEAALELQPAVERACCIFDRRRQRLLAFAVPQPQLVALLPLDLPVRAQKISVTEQQLQEALRALLPHYMVPQRIYWYRTLPLNPHGKLDRASLSKRYEEA